MAIGTLKAILLKVRRIIGLLNEYQIPDSSLIDYVNSFYQYDFPAQFRSLKLKDVYTFNTTANVDTYPFPSEQYSTLESPCYCMNREIRLSTDRWSFYGANYNWQFSTDLCYGNGTTGAYAGTVSKKIQRSYNNVLQVSQTVTGISVDTPSAGQCEVFFTSNNFLVGKSVLIDGIEGTIAQKINGATFTVVTANPASVVISLNATGLSYTSGGKAYQKPLNFDYPAGRVQNILITAMSANGNTLNVSDDGFGNLQGDVSQPQGTIDYLTGTVAGLFFKEAVASGTAIQMQYAPTTPGLPLYILFAQNQLTLRPVPDKGYSVSVTAWRLPSQALISVEDQKGTPELLEWWETVAIGAAKKYYEDQGDMENIGIMDGLLQQKYSLNATRTYAQLGKQRVQTIFQDQSGFGQVNQWGMGNYR